MQHGALALHRGRGAQLETSEPHHRALEWSARSVCGCGEREVGAGETGPAGEGRRGKTRGRHEGPNYAALCREWNLYRREGRALRMDQGRSGPRRERAVDERIA